MDENKLRKVDFDEVLDRIKGLKKLRFDYQVAEILGITKQNLAERKTRKSLPFDKLQLFCEKESINYDWLLTGEGVIRKKEFEVYGLIKREGVEGASLYSTSEGSLPEYLIEARLGIPQDTLDEWLARKKRGAIAEPVTPHEPEDPILNSIQAKIKTLYKEGNFDIKSRLVGTVELLFNELRIQKEEEQKPKIEEQKKGA